MRNIIDKAGRIKQCKADQVNNVFLFVDTGLTVLFLIVSICMMGKLCVMAFCGYYSLFYLGQAIQHYLCYRMPTMNIIKHDRTVKRCIYIVSLLEISYFIICFMFWTRSDMHPIYCLTS